MMIKDEVRFQTENQSRYAGIEALRSTEVCLKNYNRDLIDKFLAFLNSKGTILEFGAGIGTLAVLWAEKTGKKPDCFEIDQTQREMLCQRGFSSYSDFSELPKIYEGIYTSNVLEHIENDLQALKNLSSILKPGGILVIYVPAFQCLYSVMDQALGHYRRYNKKELLEKLAQANYEIVYSSYSDSVGFFASIFLKFKKSLSTTEERKIFAIYDRFIYPLSKILDRLGFQYLFGKNLFVVAKKRR